MDGPFGTAAIAVLVDMARADYPNYLANGALSTSSFSHSNPFIYDDPNTDPVSLKAYAFLYPTSVFDRIMHFYVNLNLVNFDPENPDETSQPYIGDINHHGLEANIAAVPGPEARTGLGALSMGGALLWIKRRRKAANIHGLGK